MKKELTILLGLCLALGLPVMAGCGGTLPTPDGGTDDGTDDDLDGGTGGSSQTSPLNVLNSFYGEFQVTFSGKVGGLYQPGASATTSGVTNVLQNGTLTLAGSEAGFINVATGSSVPGLDPNDVKQGVVAVQNPIGLRMSTLNSTSAGSFYLRTITALTSNPAIVLDSDCDGGQGVYTCPAEFFPPADLDGDTDNYLYFTVQASRNGNELRVTGRLVDTHFEEGFGGNAFQVPVIVGNAAGIDTFVLDRGAVFELTVNGQNITGSVNGTGYSAAGDVPQAALFEVTFQGTRR